MCGKKTQKGVAVIEFAIVLLFLLLLTVGITEIGRAFWYYSALQKAVRESARCISMVEWNTAASSEYQACRDMMLDDIDNAGVPNFSSSYVSVEPDAWGGGDGPPAAVRVRIQGYPITWLWGLGGTFQPGGVAQMSVSATMPYMR